MFNKHPKGLIAASFANLGERFGFYTMHRKFCNTFYINRFIGIVIVYGVKKYP